MRRSTTRSARMSKPWCCRARRPAGLWQRAGEHAHRQQRQQSARRRRRRRRHAGRRRQRHLFRRQCRRRRRGECQRGQRHRSSRRVSFTLGANVENLILQGSADLQGYGNGVANVLYGNTGNNLLNGGAGADLMVGGRATTSTSSTMPRDVSVRERRPGQRHGVRDAPTTGSPPTSRT